MIELQTIRLYPMLKNVSLNTSAEIDLQKQAAAWKLLLASAGARADAFALHPNKETVFVLLKDYGELQKTKSFLGVNDTAVLRGKSTPEFVHFLVDHVAPTDIDSMEFALGEQILFEHYESGKKVSANLDEEQLLRLKHVLNQAHLPENILV